MPKFFQWAAVACFVLAAALQLLATTIDRADALCFAAVGLALYVLSGLVV